MKWDRLDTEPCPVARTVAVIGDRWTLMLMRDCFLGVRRFEEFQRRLHISRTIIADRLNTLVEAGVLRREPYQDKPVRHEYRLTTKGKALYPIIISMAHWGNVHGELEPDARLRLRHKSCGHAFRPALICDECGEALHPAEVEAAAGARVSRSR